MEAKSLFPLVLTEAPLLQSSYDSKIVFAGLELWNHPIFYHRVHVPYHSSLFPIHSWFHPFSVTYVGLEKYKISRIKIPTVSIPWRWYSMLFYKGYW